MPTIYEVAKRAGVSTATVSRVLSRPDVVAETTRRRVMQAVERLGFTPNALSKHLRQARTGKLVVTVPDIANPFFSLILKGIEDAAQREGYSVLLGDTQHEEAREERYAEMLKRKEADGLIFLGHRLPKEAAELVPCVAHCLDCSDPTRARRGWLRWTGLPGVRPGTSGAAGGVIASTVLAGA